MELTFTVTRRREDPCEVEWAARGDTGPVGTVRLHDADYDRPLFIAWQTAEERARLSYDELLDAALDFLRAEGYKRLAASFTDFDGSVWHGFRLVDRDASGWDVKYIYHLDFEVTNA